MPTPLSATALDLLYQYRDLTRQMILLGDDAVCSRFVHLGAQVDELLDAWNHPTAARELYAQAVARSEGEV